MTSVGEDPLSLLVGILNDPANLNNSFLKW